MPPPHHEPHHEPHPRDSPERCAVRAELRGDVMMGTAFEQAGVLLVEQPGPWGHAGLAASHFDLDVADRLGRRADEAGLRLLVIRRPGRTRAGEGRRWAVSRAGAISWGTYGTDAELLDVALDGSAGVPDQEPTYLVCAHSKRDTCCALRGRPLAASLDELRPGRVWECSHLGGHRFGANLLVLPTGVLYGRVPSIAAAELVAATERDHVIGGLLRGPIGLTPAQQGAVVFAHQQLQVADAGAFTVADSVPTESGAVVRLAGPDGGYDVTVATEPISVEYVSCGKPAAKDELRVRPLTIARVAD
jgi:hypothetical protein